MQCLPTFTCASLLLLTAACASSSTPDADGCSDCDTGPVSDTDSGDFDATEHDGDDDDDGDAADTASDTDVGDGSGDSSDGSGADTGHDADDASVDVDPAAPWMQVGTGFAELPWEGYVPLVEGDDALITEGPQGGYHVWGGFEGDNLPPGDLSAVWSLTGLGEQAIGGAFATMVTVPYGDHVASAGITVFIDFAFDVTTLEGQPAELCLELTAGTTALTDCVGVVLRCCDYLE